jgi:hypothetical protein
VLKLYVSIVLAGLTLLAIGVLIMVLMSIFSPL